MLLRLFIFSLLLCQLTIYCQDNPTKIINQKSAGLLVEYGQPYYHLPEGTRYYFALVGGNFNFPLFQAKKTFNLSMDICPHYCNVWVVDDRNYFEFGLNIRLGFNFSVSPKDALTLKVGAGPHYINVETEKQAKGFIFSDYYLINYKRGIGQAIKPFLLEFELGYRHLSNAGLDHPNRSICNIIFGLGIYKTL